MDALNELKSYVRQLPRGPVLKVPVVEYVLVNCGDRLAASDDTSMEDYKLGDRTEDLSWNPPHLTFNLERHGGVALGGKVAEVHSWRQLVAQKQTPALPNSNSLRWRSLFSPITKMWPVRIPCPKTALRY